MSLDEQIPISPDESLRSLREFEFNEDQKS